MFMHGLVPGDNDDVLTYQAIASRAGRIQITRDRAIDL